MTTMDPLCAVCGEPASNHTHPQRDAHLRIERDQLRAELERLQKQVATMRATLEDFANPDHWNQNDDGEWVWHGYYPPFERPAVDLLGTLDAEHAGHHDTP